MTPMPEETTVMIPHVLLRLTVMGGGDALKDSVLEAASIAASVVVVVVDATVVVVVVDVVSGLIVAK